MHELALEMQFGLSVIDQTALGFFKLAYFCSGSHGWFCFGSCGGLFWDVTLKPHLQGWFPIPSRVSLKSPWVCLHGSSKNHCQTLERRFSPKEPLGTQHSLSRDTATSFWQAQPETRDLEETPGFNILYPHAVDRGDWSLSSICNPLTIGVFWAKITTFTQPFPQRSCFLNFTLLFLAPSRLAMFCASLVMVSISANIWNCVNDQEYFTCSASLIHTFFPAILANTNSYSSWDLSGSATCSAIPFFAFVHLVLEWHQLLHCEFVWAEAHCTDFRPFFKILWSFGIVILWRTPVAVLGSAQKPVNR